MVAAFRLPVVAAGHYRRLVAALVGGILLLTDACLPVLARSTADHRSAGGQPHVVGSRVDLATDPRDWGSDARPDSVPWRDSPEIRPHQPDKPPAAPKPAADFPKAAKWKVALAKPGAMGPVDGDASHAGPVTVGVAKKDADGRSVSRPVASKAEGNDVQVVIHDRATAERAGVTGFVFDLTGVGGSLSAGAMIGAGEVPLTVGVDYSGFATAFGQDLGSRLHVVALPACVLLDPVPASCDTTGVAVPAQNDPAHQKLTVDTIDLSKVRDQVTAATVALQSVPADASTSFAAAAVVPAAAVPAPDSADIATGPTTTSSDMTVMAVTSGTSSETGSWEASALSQTGDWDVSAGSGEFSYSLPVDLPAPPGGQAPSVGTSYSSGVVDGLTHATNPQASQVGLGWSDFANAFIERGYDSCAEAEVLPSALWGNLCYRDNNATISLGGVSGRLIPVDTSNTQWRVQGDPGWRVERTALPDPNQKNYVTQENWKVTAPDGTQYFFGLHTSNPDASTTTNSVWWVPVVSDHAGEPCWQTDKNLWDMCNMAYRWMLDRVVDPDGNLTTYYYNREANNYKSWPGIADKVAYIRSGYLTKIEYGGRAGAGKTQMPAVRVTFDTQNRCWFLTPNCPGAVSGSTSFFDVPIDMICDTQTSCPQGAPTFFSSKRYSAVRTEVLVGTSYKLVSTYILAAKAARFTDDTGSADYMMYLDWAQQLGTGLVAFPKTAFEYTFLHNAVQDQTNTSARMWRARLLRVTNPSGGQVTVTYSGNTCPATYQPPGGLWDANVQPCFPQLFKDKKAGITRHGMFNKYRVQRVEEAPGFGADSQVTQYTYSGDAAWAHDRRAGDNEQVKWGWTVWRGYGDVTVTKGTATSGLSKTRTLLFRGMDDDLIMTADGCVCGRRDVFLGYADGSAGPEDKWWLAGRPLEEQQLGTIGTATDTPLTSTRYSYVKSDLIDPANPREEFRPTWSAVADLTERVWSSNTAFRERGTTTTYNAHFQPATTVEEGWLDSSTDDRCSVTSYADNETAGMFTYPAVNETRAGTDCINGALLSRQETYYDTSSILGAAPSRGNATKTRIKIDATRWSETTMGYDSFGRVTSVTDPGGATTTTAFTPAGTSAIPTKTEVSNALGQKTTTDWDPVFGQPTKETDPQGNVTTWTYDTLGRVSTVRRPSEQGTADPSLAFSYALDEDDASDADLLPEIPPIVRTHQLQSIDANGNGVFDDSWVIYDGFGRERQTQEPSPDSGKVLVGEKRYDARGLLREDIAPEPVPGSPGFGYVSPSTWQNRTRHLYDELGRETHTQVMTPGSSTSVETDTVTTYGPDTVTTTGPDGVTTRETSDGLGRRVETEEHDGSTWVPTLYGYDLADNLTTVTDPAGNVTTNTYNLAGWQTDRADPDRGAAQFEYDTAGRQTMVEDAAHRQVWTNYDVLGRATERRADNPTTGSLLASWAYDTVKPGLLTSSTRDTAGGNWTTTVNSYDDKNRPTSTTLSVPAGIAGLSGSYTLGQTFDRADHPQDTSYPAVGGLPAETVRSAYNGFGLPATLSGLDTYVWTTVYDGRARPVLTGVGPQDASGPFGIKVASRNEFDSQQRLSRAYVWVPSSSVNSGVLTELKPTYRKDGLVTSRDTSINEHAWRECYGYDRRARLTSAYTVVNGADCTSANKGGGDQPFDRSYSYLADGRMNTRTQDSTTTSYTYPAAGAGSVHPHAPSKVGTQSYTWNADGSLATRTVANGTETYTWDAEHELASILGPGGTTRFVYDVDGQRLLRTIPDGSKTLYFAGHEVTANATGTTVTAVRSYVHNGQVVATRSPAGVDYLATDGSGSVEATVASGTTALSGSRRYDPYGQVRTETGASFQTDRGFLGQIEDPTGLSYLNARYYDTRAELFVSADPVSGTSNPKSLNPYTYGLDNPVANADPTGLASTALWGTEVENNELRGHIRNLQGILREMGPHIGELQDIIRKQQKVINDLIVENNALRSIIAQQQVVIRALAARVVYLEGQVAYWRGRAIYWRSQAIYWRGRARFWQGRAIFWHGQATLWHRRSDFWQGVAVANMPPVFHSSFAAREGGLYAGGGFRNTLQAREGPFPTVPRGSGGSGGGGGDGSLPGYSPIHIPDVVGGIGDILGGVGEDIGNGLGWVKDHVSVWEWVDLGSIAHDAAEILKQMQNLEMPSAPFPPLPGCREVRLFCKEAYKDPPVV